MPTVSIFGASHASPAFSTLQALPGAPLAWVALTWLQVALFAFVLRGAGGVAAARASVLGVFCNAREVRRELLHDQVAVVASRRCDQGRFRGSRHDGLKEFVVVVRGLRTEELSE